MKIGFIGTGYVGLVSGILIANFKHQVVCLDTDIHKIQNIERGKLPIYEPGLDNYLAQAKAANNLSFTTDYQDLADCEAVFICVGTPSQEDGNADLSYVKQAILQAAAVTPENTLLIIKSTVPPRTAFNIQELLKEHGYSHQIASNPEFLREGAAIADFTNPDRIIVGCTSLAAQEIFQNIYASFIAKNTPFLVTSPTTAELIKYTSNSFLAIKIGFINEMSDLCEIVEGDIDQLAYGVGLDQRIGPLFLQAGPGYGGSCFPKDTLALSYLANSYNQPSQILNAAIKSNFERHDLMLQKIKSIIGEIKGKKLAILGASFKANTDDIRSSPAVEIIKKLIEEQASLSLFDPVAMDNFARLHLPVKLAVNIIDACDGCEAVIILTEWPEFSNIDWQQLSKKMPKKIIIDLRRIVLNFDLVKSSGFTYYTIGNNSAR